MRLTISMEKMVNVNNVYHRYAAQKTTTNDANIETTSLVEDVAGKRSDEGCITRDGRSHSGRNRSKMDAEKLNHHVHPQSSAHTEMLTNSASLLNQSPRGDRWSAVLLPCPSTLQW